jgi:hypothetical protein
MWESGAAENVYFTLMEDQPAADGASDVRAPQHIGLKPDKKLSSRKKSTSLRAGAAAAASSGGMKNVSTQPSHGTPAVASSVAKISGEADLDDQECPLTCEALYKVLITAYYAPEGSKYVASAFSV